MVLETPDGFYWTCHGHGRCVKTIRRDTIDKLVADVIRHLASHTPSTPEEAQTEKPQEPPSEKPTCEGCNEMDIGPDENDSGIKIPFCTKLNTDVGRELINGEMEYFDKPDNCPKNPRTRRNEVKELKSETGYYWAKPNTKDGDEQPVYYSKKFNNVQHIGSSLRFDISEWVLLKQLGAEENKKAHLMNNSCCICPYCRGHLSGNPYCECWECKGLEPHSLRKPQEPKDQGSPEPESSEGEKELQANFVKISKGDECWDEVEMDCHLCGGPPLNNRMWWESGTYEYPDEGQLLCDNCAYQKIHEYDDFDAELYQKISEATPSGPTGENPQEPENSEGGKELPELIQKLVEKTDEKGFRISFSANCISGYIGKNKCQCKRCRQDRGEEVTKESEFVAKEMRKEAEKKRLVGGWEKATPSEDMIAEQRGPPKPHEEDA